MHVAPILRDLIVLLTVSLPLVFLCRRLGMPGVVGFLATGILIGPTATGIVESPERVEMLAEMGVVLLLFTIGLEFSLARLAKMSRFLFGCGSLQVFSTGGIVYAVAWALGYEFGESLVLAFIVALSSTAVTLTLLENRGELEAQHGGLTLAVLLFQDLCVLPIMLILPLVAESESATAGSVVFRMLTALAVIAVVVFAARKLLPRLLHQILQLRSRELFIGTVVVACFGTAWLTAELGLSLAIGAFLAGLLVSESEYSHQVVAEVLPLRDLFSSVFFVSVGMLLDLPFLADNAALVAAIVISVMILKSLTGAASVLPFRASPRIALLVGVALAQIGEFSFVIAGEASRLAILQGETLQLVLSASVFSMLLTPLATQAAGHWAASGDIPGPAPDPDFKSETAPHGHVVVIGYGHNGQNLTRVLKESGVPYTIVDLDLDAVQAARDRGEAAVFGDASRAVVLEHVHALTASAVAVTFSHPAIVRRVVALARGMNEHAAIVCRTPYVADIEDLYELGATEVIPEEFETSVEMFSRVLQCLNVPKNIVTAQVEIIRSRHYAMLRDRSGGRPHLESIYELFTAATTVTHLIREGSPATGRRLDEIDLRETTGVRLIALVRKGEAIGDPPGEMTVSQGDIFVMIGSHAQLDKARRLLDPKEALQA
jgi:CPA2 family monovalent cation:H+ antiporter-2